MGYRSTKEGRWVAAANLQAGDTLLATADRKLTVTSIEARHERTWVYNLTVAGTHTYTVGTAGVVTHNRCKLRDNLGDPPAGMANPQAHHDLAQKFRSKFESLGLDIDAAENGRWVSGNPQGNHQSWSGAFNREWENFFNANPNATKKQVLELKEKLAKDPRFQ